MSSLRRRFVLALVAIVCIVNCIFSPPATAAGLVGPSWATKLLLYNASNKDAVVLVVIQAAAAAGNAQPQDGCPIDIRYLRYIDFTAHGTAQPLVMFSNSSTGWFKLKRGHTAQVYSTAVDPVTHQPTYCLQGFNIAFNGQSASCPNLPMSFPDTTAGPLFNQDVSKFSNPPAFTNPPNGVNGFEGSLNLTGVTGGSYTPGAQEAIDITCLGGASTKLMMQIVPPVRGPFWSTGVGPAAGGTAVYRRAATFENSWVKIVDGQPGEGCDDNCVDPRTGLARPGVFPYGCSICNAFPDPNPPCGVKSPKADNYASQFCAAKNLMPAPPGGNGCQLNRAPLPGGQQFGGIIRVVYLGPLSPPRTCP